MPDPAGVFARIRRDRQISNLMYGLLGFEDERDPQAAIASLAKSAREILEGAGPQYRTRVLMASQMLVALVLDVAEAALPVAEGSVELVPAELEAGEVVETSKPLDEVLRDGGP